MINAEVAQQMMSNATRVMAVMESEAVQDGFYYVTERNAVDTIMNEGLSADEMGRIYIVNTSDEKIIDYMAANQLFIEDYAIIEINEKGFQGKLYPDIVGELTAKYQWFVQQDAIDPKYLSTPVPHGL